MLFNSLRATRLALAVAAPAVYAASTLSLKLTCPDTVNGVEDLTVTTTLTNNGGETVKILNGPNIILDALPTDKFNIINTDGFSSDFVSVTAKYSPTRAVASSTDASDVTVIAPDQSVSFTHDLSVAYDFTDTGYGMYTVEASNRFHTLGPNNTFSIILADSELCSVSLTRGPLAVTAPSPMDHADCNDCSTDQLSALNAAAAATQEYARKSHSYLQINLGPSPRYAMWFGEYTGGRHSTVHDHFSKMRTNNFTGFRYDCTCMHNTTYAYVYPSRFGTVYLCGAFWRAPLTGTDSKAGTLIHEASNFIVNGGTKDYAYNQYHAKELAQSSPDDAVFNADSHEYFAENNPGQP